MLNSTALPSKIRCGLNFAFFLFVARSCSGVSMQRLLCPLSFSVSYKREPHSSSKS